MNEPVVKSIAGRTIRLGGGIALLVGALATGAPAGETDARSRGSLVRTPRCTEADIAWVTLPAGAAIDGVRVTVAAGSSPTSAADVAVHAGPFDRVVHVRGDSRAMTFSPPLIADNGALAVTLDPVWDASTAACIERIELLRGGAVVGSVRPR